MGERTRLRVVRWGAGREGGEKAGGFYKMGAKEEMRVVRMGMVEALRLRTAGRERWACEGSW